MEVTRATRLSLSSFSRWLVIPLVFLVLVSFSVTGKADITGIFETHIEFFPQSTVSEISLQFFDIENDLTINYLVSGLRTTFHTHFGIGGVEDVIVTTTATIGFIELQSLLVFARFPSGSINPFYPALHFVKKQVTTEVLLGGVSIENVATFEDTNAFVSQTPAYAFGDVFTVVGSTPSGVNISAQAAICKERIANAIKKHVVAPFSVNPDCATEPKPDILFDFERVTISGVPIAPNVTGSSVLDCVRVMACDLTATTSITGGIVPFQFDLVFRDVLGGIEFNGAIVNFTFDVGTFSILFGANGLIAQTRGVLAVTLNPESNPADFTFRFTVIPGTGLTSAVLTLAVTRGPLRFSARANYGGGPPLEFEELFFDLTAVRSGFELSVASRFEPDGLQEASINVTVFF